MQLSLHAIESKIIEFINSLFPKQDCIYLFSTFPYKDNIHALLDEILHSGLDSKFRIYCDGPAFSTYSSDYVSHVRHGSPKSLLAFLRSKYVFYDIGIYGQIKGGKDQSLINTWHGTSLKCIEYYLEKNRTKRMPPLCSYSIAYSSFFKPVIEKAFGLDSDRVLVTGEPRNDYLYDEDRESILGKLGIIKGNGKLVIWMPTWRQNKRQKDEIDGASYRFGIPLLDEDGLEELNSACIENDVKLIIKWHGLQDYRRIDEKKYSAILFLTSDSIAATDEPLYHLIASCDALITDYSSIYVNYLVLNRPICFAYDDLDEYKRNRGFMFDDVESIMPGKHVHDVSGIADFIKELGTMQMDDEDSQKRQSVNALLNKYNDNRNSYRLLKALELLD